MTTLPTSVWDQLAVVGAFIVFLAGVWAFLRWVLNWARSLITEQRAEWQKFIDGENAKSRAWLEQQECNNRATIERVSEANRKSMGQVAEALELVIDQLKSIAEQITAHDHRVDNKFQEAVTLVKNGNGNMIPERRRAPRNGLAKSRE